MAETTIDLRGLPATEAYAELLGQTEAVLEGIDDDVAAMATISALIYNGFGHLWAGFYRVVKPNELLRVGPYQGTLGCMEIQFGRGVCGTAASERRTVIVEDVNEFPGHIACDARSRSEIVVPVFNAANDLIAVLDIDSETPGSFDEEDREGLERVVAWFAKKR
ncbi:MAG TPA: GAF domain-containing protein [Gemmatimonadaceae bacterium]